MGLCGSDDEAEAPEFDELPRGLRWRMQFARKNVEKYPGREVLRLGRNRVIKKGGLPTEYEALRTVDRHTSVPIPKVIGVYHTRDGLLAEYEAFPGKPLPDVWHNLAQPQRKKIVQDIGRFVDQMRKIEPPKHEFVGSAFYGAAFDKRFGSGNVGPFYTVEAFHDFLRRGHPTRDFSDEQLKKCHERTSTYELKFTHASLCPANILIDEAGRIACIIGWESAGWWPEYWEYTQMYCGTPAEMREWLDEMKKVLPKYDEEVAAEEALRRRFRASVYDTPRSIRAPSPTPSELARELREIDDKNTESTSG